MQYLCLHHSKQSLFYLAVSVSSVFSCLCSNATANTHLKASLSLSLSFSTGSAVNPTPRRCSCAGPQRWTPMPGADTCRWSSCWTTCASTSRLWCRRPSSTSWTPHCDHSTSTTPASPSATSLAASSLWRLGIGGIQDPVQGDFKNDFWF